MKLELYHFINGEGPATLTVIEELEKKIAPDQSSAGFLDPPASGGGGRKVRAAAA